MKIQVAIPDINKQDLARELIASAYAIHKVRKASRGDGVTTNGERNTMANQIANLAQAYRAVVDLIKIESGEDRETRSRVSAQLDAQLIEPILREDKDFFSWFRP